MEFDSSNWEFYNLKPVKFVEPEWVSLKHQFIRRKTWNFAIHKNYNGGGLGIRIFDHGMHNGWGRGCDGFICYIDLFNKQILFWMRWNFIVMTKGPLDSRHGPIDVSHLIKPNQKTLNKVEGVER